MTVAVSDIDTAIKAYRNSRNPLLYVSQILVEIAHYTISYYIASGSDL